MPEARTLRQASACGVVTHMSVRVMCLMVHKRVIMSVFSLMLVPGYMTLVMLRMFSFVTIEGVIFVMFL